MSEINEDNIIKFSELKHFNKSDLIELGQKAAAVLTEDGYNDAYKMIIATRKAIEYLNSLSRALESQATDEIMLEDNNEATAYGSTISMSSTGDRLNYKEDAAWSKLKKAITEREAILKLAGKQDVEGVTPVGLASAGKTVLRVKL